jgi:hypothetical protein
MAIKRNHYSIQPLRVRFYQPCPPDDAEEGFEASIPFEEKATPKARPRPARRLLSWTTLAEREPPARRRWERRTRGDAATTRRTDGARAGTARGPRRRAAPSSSGCACRSAHCVGRDSRACPSLLPTPPPPCRTSLARDWTGRRAAASVCVPCLAVCNAAACSGGGRRAGFRGAAADRARACKACPASEMSPTPQPSPPTPPLTFIRQARAGVEVRQLHLVAARPAQEVLPCDAHRPTAPSVCPALSQAISDAGATRRRSTSSRTASSRCEREPHASARRRAPVPETRPAGLTLTWSTRSSAAAF